MERPEFVKDLASQRLYFEALEGRPSATPNVVVKDKGGAVLSANATTNVTLNTVDTTIDQSAALGTKTSLGVASTTGIELGKTYRLTNAQKQVDYVTVRAINATAGTVDLASPLDFAFTTDRGTNDFGDFESTEFYYTLQTADINSLRELAVATATYVVGGVTYKQRRAFDIVLVPLWNPLTVGEMYERWPDLARQEPDEQRGTDYAPQRKTAWAKVKRRLRQQAAAEKQWRPAMVFDAGDLSEVGWSVLKRELHLIGVEVDRDEPSRETLDEEIEVEYGRAFTGVFLDLTEDESIGDKSEGVRYELDFVR